MMGGTLRDTSIITRHMGWDYWLIPMNSITTLVNGKMTYSQVGDKRSIVNNAFITRECSRGGKNTDSAF